MKNRFILLYIFFILLLALIAMKTVASEYVVFNLFLAIATTCTFFISLFFYRKELKLFVKTSYFQKLMIYLIRIFLIGAILCLINFLVYKNDVVTDITKNKIHTLSEQSISILKTYKDKEISFKLFAKRNDWDRYRALLNLYKNELPSLKLELIDLELNPALVSLYNIKENGTLVIEIDGNKHLVVIKDELTLTNMLIKINSPEKRHIYYSVGHNEFSLSDKNAIGGDYLREKLTSLNYQILPVEMTSSIPADAHLVMILNPQIDFVNEEIMALEKYLSMGGSLMLSIAPQFTGVELPNLLKLINRFGATFHNGLILDRLANQQGSQASTPVITNYTDHPITKNFSGRTLFPVSSFITFEENSHYQYEALIATAPFPATWGEMSFEEVKNGRAEYNEGIDSKGPLSIIVLGESKDNSRISLIGSMAFVSNQFQAQSNNFNLFLNIISWQTKEDSLITLNRPSLTTNLVYISDIQISLLFYFAILIFPFSLFLASIYFYRKRLNN